MWERTEILLLKGGEKGQAEGLLDQFPPLEEERVFTLLSSKKRLNI